MVGMKDNSVLSDTRLIELVKLATQCSKEIVTITVATTPDTTPSGTPSSTPPPRRKRWQRQSGPKSPPNKEKSNTLSLPIGGEASTLGKGNKQPVTGEEELLVMLTVPLTNNWNAEIVYTVELEPEEMVSPCLTN